MDLSKKERLTWIHQLRILEALYPDEADYYAKQRTALENGYTLHYDWMLEHLSDGLTEGECSEVLDILEMYRAITFALEKIDDDDDLKEHYLAKFAGFDGNNETELMGYTRYFIVDLDRYSELRRGEYPYFNSHAPMLERYRAMIVRWESINRRFDLNRDQVAMLLGATP